MERKNKIGILLLISLSILIFASNLAIAEDYKCYTMVEYNSEIIQINPKQSEIFGIGIIDYFEPQPEGSKYQYVKVYFTKKDLRDNEAVNFSVVCSGENQTLTFEREITPNYKDLNTTVIEPSIWIINNMSFIILGFFVLLLIILAIIILVRLAQWK